MCFEFINVSDFGAVNFFLQNTPDAVVGHKLIKSRGALYRTDDANVSSIILTRGSAIAEEPRDALRQLKYYGRFLTELLTRSSANPEEPCEHIVS